jgi:hypothetical protein
VGWWLEILGERPLEDESYLDTRPEIILGEHAPGPLIDAARLLKGEAMAGFPALALLRTDVGPWEDEDLWLDGATAGRVLADFRRFRAVGRYELVLPELRAEHVRSYWRRDWPGPEAWEAWADKLEALLERAAQEGLWVRVMR